MGGLKDDGEDIDDYGDEDVNDNDDDLCVCGASGNQPGVNPRVRRWLGGRYPKEGSRKAPTDGKPALAGRTRTEGEAAGGCANQRNGTPAMGGL